MGAHHEAMLERLRAYEGRFRLIAGMNGLDSEIVFGSFPELHLNGSPSTVYYNVRREYNKFCIHDLPLPNSMLMPLIDLDSERFVVCPIRTRKSTALISVARPHLFQYGILAMVIGYDTYENLADISDDVLDGIVAHEVGHYLDRKKRVPTEVKYVLRTRGGLRDAPHVHAAIDIIGSYVVSRHAICSMLEYLRSHQPDSVELDVRTKQVELYGFK